MKKRYAFTTAGANAVMEPVEEEQVERRAENRHVNITRPNFQYGTFLITGAAPLVIHRFSQKAKQELASKVKEGGPSRNRRSTAPKDANAMYEAAKYSSPEGWEGFNASSIRNAMISACRVAGYHMTLAKLTLFVEADGWDAEEPQIPLVRIYGDSVMQEDIGRNSQGQPIYTVRAAYHEWYSRLTLRWDADQFNVDDIVNLLMRAGMQVGIGDGRPDSPKSAGMGWGLFTAETNSKGEAKKSGRNGGRNGSAKASVEPATRNPVRVHNVRGKR